MNLVPAASAFNYETANEKAMIVGNTFSITTSQGSFSQSNINVEVSLVDQWSDVYYCVSIVEHEGTEDEFVYVSEELYTQLAKTAWASEIREFNADTHKSVEVFELKIAA